METNGAAWGKEDMRVILNSLDMETLLAAQKAVNREVSERQMRELVRTKYTSSGRKGV